MTRRAVVLVCDGLGVGAAPDADAYGDVGSDTLRHVLERHPTPLPNLERLGLLTLVGLGTPRGARGKATELSAGKDTTTGHWEMMGLVTERPFPLYPNGFPPEIVLPWQPTHEKGNANAPPSKVTYRCPACAIKAWGKPGLLLMCLVCDQPLASGQV